jgi:hypothetical protein
MIFSIDHSYWMAQVGRVFFTRIDEEGKKLCIVNVEILVQAQIRVHHWKCSKRRKNSLLWAKHTAKFSSKFHNNMTVKFFMGYILRMSPPTPPIWAFTTFCSLNIYYYFHILTHKLEKMDSFKMNMTTWANYYGRPILSGHFLWLAFFKSLYPVHINVVGQSRAVIFCDWPFESHCIGRILQV